MKGAAELSRMTTEDAHLADGGPLGRRTGSARRRDGVGGRLSRRRWTLRTYLGGNGTACAIRRWQVMGCSEDSRFAYCIEYSRSERKTKPEPTACFLLKRPLKWYKEFRPVEPRPPSRFG